MTEAAITDYYSQEDILLPLLAALKEEDYKTLSKQLVKQHPSDIAELLNLCDADDREKIIALLPDVDSEVLTYLDDDVKEQIASFLGIKASAEVIDKLESNDAVQFVENLPEEKREEILEQLSTEKRLEVEDALAYPEDSAARLANKDFVAVSVKYNVGNVIDFLRASENLPRDFYNIFVLDDEDRPMHYIPVSRIMRSMREIWVVDIMEPIEYSIPANVDQEEVANIFKKYNIISTPVVDAEGKMIGEITVDDITYVIEEEASEDMLALAGIGEESDVFSSSIKKFKSRAPWLIINLFTAILSTLIISKFEGTLTKIMALAALMPVVSALSGNVATQALTVTVRALSMKELAFSNYLKVLFKEISASLLNGLLVGLVAFIFSYFIFHDFHISLLMYFSLMITFIVGVTVGSLVPLLMQKFNQDPAVTSPVFVTATTDVVAFFFFLGSATLLLL